VMFTPHGVLGGGSYHQSGGGAPDASVPLGKEKGRVTELEQEFFSSQSLPFFPVIHLLSEPDLGLNSSTPFVTDHGSFWN